MKMRSFVFAALGLSMASSFAVSAAELGSLSLVSRLGEPFDARLVVRDLKEGETAQVTIADEKLYKRIGKTRAPESTTLKIAAKADAKGRVRIIGSEPMQLKEFPLILLLKTDGKVKAKVYNVKLAAPRSVASGEGKKTSVAAVEHKENLAHVPSASTPVASVPTAAKKVSTPVAKTSKAKEVRVAKSSKKTVTAKPVAKKPVVAKTSKAKATKKVEHKKVAKKISPNQKIRVEKGMTMWSIAQTARSSYPKASADRIIVGFMRANPDAFKSGATSVRRGALLRAPTVAEVNAIAEEEARAIVRAKPVVASSDKLSVAEKSISGQVPAAGDSDVIEKTIAATSTAQAASQGTDSKTPSALEEGKKLDAPSTQIKEASPSAASQNVDKNASPAAVEKTPTTEKPQTEQTPEKPAVESKVESSKVDTPKEEGGSSSLLATVIFAVVVLVGGFFFARKRRGKRTSQGVEELRAPSTSQTKETPVVFHKEEPKTEPSQIDGIEKTVTQRIESDRYAERGFELKGESVPAKALPEASPAVESPKEENPVVEEKPVAEENPVVVEKTTEVSPAEPTEVVSPIVEPQTQSTANLSDRIEPTLGIDLPGKETEETTTSPSTETKLPEDSVEAQVAETGKERTIDAQIEEARALLEGSLSEKALEILEQIALNGDEKQRAAALRLLTLRDRK